MEDNIQVIIGMIISVFIFFIFPVYMAYEKKDDIAYALAMRYTQDFVDEVRNKGYISDDMLNKYKEKLAITGNSYDIELTHAKKRIDPITQYYRVYGDTEDLVKTTTRAYKVYEDERIYDELLREGRLDPTQLAAGREYYINEYYRNREGIDKIVETYNVSEEIYSTNHIEAVLATENKMWTSATTDDFICVDDTEPESYNTITKRVRGCENVYILNKEDEFNVTIKNTNTTLATVLYNMVTINTVDNNTRIYINYGGKILNEKWYGKIDYTKMKHDSINIYNMSDRLVIPGTKIFSQLAPYYFESMYEAMSGKEYMLEFEVKPYTTTELREKGHVITEPATVKQLYNIAAGIHPDTGGLQVSIGINGICILTSKDHENSKVILSCPVTITNYTKIRIKLQSVGTVQRPQYKVVLYVNDQRAGESIAVSGLPLMYRVGQGYLSSASGINYQQGFDGEIRNVRLYYYE